MPGASDSQRILVTGAGGFIGQRLATRLHETGRAVVGTDLAPPSDHKAGDFRFVTADVRDLGRHAAIVAEGCDGIIHCGGISGPMLAQDNPAELLDINIRGTSQLLDLARVFGLRRFLGCSSVSAYGDTGERAEIDEATPLNASTVYGTSKAAMDLIVQTYAARHGLSAAALRIGWVYGPRRRTDGVLRPMIRSGLGGPAFKLARGGEQLLQFVHVDDLVSAMIAAFDAPSLPRAAYNVNGGDLASVREIAALVTTLLPGAAIEIGPGPMDDTDRQGRMLLGAMAHDFGWHPATTLGAGIAAYVGWLRDHPY